MLPPVILQAACRLQELVSVLARGEDAGSVAWAVALYHKSHHSAAGRGSAPGGHAPSCGSLAGVAGGFHPATAAVLCLR